MPSETTAPVDAPAWQPAPSAPPPELDALRPFFFDCTWEGTVYANMQAPGSPEMVAVGAATCRWILDGLWLAQEAWQDQYHNGQKLLAWKLNMIAGWDKFAREYRAVLVDSNGVSALLRGEIDGRRLVMTPIGLAPGAGQVASLRFIWEVLESGEVTWRNEASIDGSPWMLIEDYVMAPAAQGAA